MGHSGIYGTDPNTKLIDSHNAYRSTQTDPQQHQANGPTLRDGGVRHVREPMILPVCLSSDASIHECIHTYIHKCIPAYAPAAVGSMRLHRFPWISQPCGRIHGSGFRVCQLCLLRDLVRHPGDLPGSKRARQRAETGAVRWMSIYAFIRACVV